MGLITTWLVAWAIGVWAPFNYGATQGQDYDGSGAGAHMRGNHANGVDYLVVMLGIRPDDPEYDPSCLNDLLHLDFVPRWSRAHQCWSDGVAVPPEAIDPDHDPSFGGIWHEAAFGWPLPALRAVFRPRPLDGLTPPRWLPGQRDGTPHPCLPYKPVWSGLLFDTAVFAVAWFGTGFVYGAVRRRWRVSQGNCPCCGYDLLGIEGVCPECGNGRLPESSPYRSPDASCAPRHRGVRLVRAAKLALVLLVVLLIGWGIKVATERPPDWTPFRENARAVLLRVTDDPAVTSYIVQNFDAVADSAEHDYGEKRSRWKKVDLRGYLDSVRIALFLQAHDEGRLDVYETLYDYRRVLPD